MRTEFLEGSPSSSIAGEWLERVTILDPSTRVSEACDTIRSEGTPVAQVAVCEEGRLRGFVGASALLIADPGASLETLLRPAAAVVESTAGLERAAWLAAHAGVDAVAVVDEAGRFLGLIPVSRLLSLMVHEHEIDLARLGGFLRGAARARTAGEEAVALRVWHRVPWLMIGLFGAVVAAQIVRAFEGRIEDTVALAFFLPGVVYMADAVGTQTETLVIRGFSVGVSQTRILRLEMLTGAIIGGLLSAAIFPLAWAVTGESMLALIVSLALLAATATATVIAVTLPSFLQKLGVDPAFGSGPLATVIQDILSIALYFGIAVALLGSD